MSMAAEYKHYFVPAPATISTKISTLITDSPTSSTASSANSNEEGEEAEGEDGRDSSLDRSGRGRPSSLSTTRSAAAAPTTTAANPPPPPPLPTWVASRSAANTEEGQTGGVDLSALSVEENSSSSSSWMAVPVPSTSSNTNLSTAPTGKTRRASTLSSSSSTLLSTSAGSNGEEEGEEGEDGRGAERDESKPTRRKAPRMGSYSDEGNGRRRTVGVGSSGGAGLMRGDEEALVDDSGIIADSETEPEVEEEEGSPVPPTDSTSNPSPFTSLPTAPLPTSSSSTSTPSASTSRLPPNSRPPIPPLQTSPPPPPPPPLMSTPSPPAPSHPHVNIVTYPSNDLLKLLAALLEQIAKANDALNQRNNNAPSSASAGGSGSSTPGGGGIGSGLTMTMSRQEEDFDRGRFDAAPLNSPVTPRYNNSRSRRRSLADGVGMMMSEDGGEDALGGGGGSNDLGGEGGEEEYQEEEDQVELPVTPGLDLLREVGDRGGVAGFMPSLGGNTNPIPLARRRGSSFLNNSSSNGGTTANQGKSRHPTPTRSLSQTTTTPDLESAPPEPEPITSLLTASSQALASPSSTLCFHARNIPAISIESYLLRILKYCPTTNEVFLSLLVYFDRMARVGLEARRIGIAGTAVVGESEATATGPKERERLFAIDSFNVHRLVIAGVTVASKFFSDVFYTNSRYAKVGGLPLNELNQLELQFLLLNDFRLVIPVDELQRYADQLILFWVGRNASSTPASALPIPPTPTAPSPITVHQTTMMPRDGRPHSIRSQQSSSGTSVTSTITPGTPSTTRGSETSEAGSDYGHGSRDGHEEYGEEGEHGSGGMDVDQD